LLIPNHAAGAIIGKHGVFTKQVSATTGCQLQISSPDQLFPGTDNRILLMGGNSENLEDCIGRVFKKIQQTCDRGGNFMVKLVVPNSSVSTVIGNGGQKIKRLSSATSCNISVSSRVDGFLERIIRLQGSYDGVVNAAFQVCKLTQADPHMAQHFCLKYDIKIPLGIWAGPKAAPLDPCSVPLSPSNANGMTKCELVQYLRKAAPRVILMRRGLLGNMKNMLKFNRKALMAAVSDTYLSRVGDSLVDDDADLETSVHSTAYDQSSAHETESCSDTSEGTVLECVLQDKDSEFWGTETTVTGDGKMTHKVSASTISPTTTSTANTPLTCDGMMGRGATTQDAVLAAAGGAQPRAAAKMSTSWAEVISSITMTLNELEVSGLDKLEVGEGDDIKLLIPRLHDIRSKVCKAALQADHGQNIHPTASIGKSFL